MALSDLLKIAFMQRTEPTTIEESSQERRGATPPVVRRLHNHLALRLAGFLVKHRANVRHGLVP
jgi:hypothetical protein